MWRFLDFSQDLMDIWYLRAKFGRTKPAELNNNSCYLLEQYGVITNYSIGTSLGATDHLPIIWYLRVMFDRTVPAKTADNSCYLLQPYDFILTNKATDTKLV